MANGRLGSYTSFFSQRIANTTSSVSELASAKNIANIKTSITHQYAKCQSNFKELVTSNTVTQIKDNLGGCKQTAFTGYEKAKLSVNEVLASERLQSIAASLKNNAIYCNSVAKVSSDKFKETVSESIGYENIERLNQHCDQYKEVIGDNYNLAKTKLNNFMRSEEVLRVKSIYDGSMNAVLSTNFLFDLGLMLVPGTDSYYVTLQCSKYLMASIIFVISACKSYDTRKQDYTTHEHAELYQSQIDEAYDVISQLHKVFSHIESLLQINYGQVTGSMSVSSKDFEAARDNAALEDINFDLNDFNIYVKALLDGASKANWMTYLLKLISVSFPVASSFSGLIVMTVLAYATISALRKYQLRVEDEAKIELLQKKLEPIYATLRNLENKLYSDPEYKQGNLDQEIQPLPRDLSKELFSIELNSITDGIAKTSGLYFVLQTMLHTYSSFNHAICLVVFCFAIRDIHASKQKQQNLYDSYEDLESKMKELVDMTETMKNLSVKQEDYEQYLIESAKVKEEFRKIAEAYKVEVLRKVEETHQQEELRKLEEARLQKEFVKLEEVRHQEEFRKTQEARRQEEARKAEDARQQAEFKRLEEIKVQDFIKKLELEYMFVNMRKWEEEQRYQREVLRARDAQHAMPEQQIMTDLKRDVVRENKVVNNLQAIEMQPYPFISRLPLVSEEQEAASVNEIPHLKTRYLPAIIAGLTGAGIGWVLGVYVGTLLAVPTLGLSLVVPALCACIAGVIAYAAAYWVSNRGRSEPTVIDDKKVISQPDIIERNFISRLFCNSHKSNLGDRLSSPHSCKDILNREIFFPKNRFGIIK